jgi:hypothetical protein
MSWVFCAIVAGEAAAIPIYEDDNYLAILDIRPFTRGHTLGRRLVKGWGSAQRCPSTKYVGELSQREIWRPSLVTLRIRFRRFRRCRGGLGSVDWQR